MTELCSIDLLIIDDFALEPMSRDESRDIYQLFVERTGRAPTIITSNRDTADWLAVFDDPLLGQGPSIASRTTPTTSSSTASRIAPGSSPASTRTGLRLRLR